MSESPAGASPVERVVSRIVCAYLRWRHGGNVWALKPPLGWNKYIPASVLYKARYLVFLKPRWMAEKWLFNRFGQPMRDAWPGGITLRMS